MVWSLKLQVVSLPLGNLSDQELFAMARSKRQWTRWVCLFPRQERKFPLCLMSKRSQVDMNDRKSEKELPVFPFLLISRSYLWFRWNRQWGTTCFHFSRLRYLLGVAKLPGVCESPELHRQRLSSFLQNSARPPAPWPCGETKKWRSGPAILGALNNNKNGVRSCLKKRPCLYVNRNTIANSHSNDFRSPKST